MRFLLALILVYSVTACTYVIITDSPVRIEGKIPITVGKDE